MTNIQAIPLPLSYPNMYIVPLENFVEKNVVMYSPDILSLINDKLDWANSDALASLFKLDNFQILGDSFALLNQENEDVINAMIGNKEDEEKFSTLNPKWLMGESIRSWDGEKEAQDELIKSQIYVLENYLIESKVLVFPSKVYGGSAKSLNRINKIDYFALKFWVLSPKAISKMTSSDKKILELSESPIIIMLGLYKMNMTHTTYQIPQNLKGIYNPLNKELKKHPLTKNYQREDRLYLAVNRFNENQIKLDMSVIRNALVHALITSKIGLMNVDMVSYEIKNF
jgi:hypothetical protein